MTFSRDITLKRVFDVAAATSGIILASPLLLAGSLAAMADHGGLLFKQNRVGKDGETFSIYKIKTMKDAFNSLGQPLAEDLRTSRIGKILRKTKIDELPQLFNVLKGDMSIIGPRPWQGKHEDASDPIRQSMKPGLTGLAQLYGGTILSHRESLQYDHAYITAYKQRTALRNLVHDITIAAKTLPAIIKHYRDPHFYSAPKTSVTPANKPSI